LAATPAPLDCATPLVDAASARPPRMRWAVAGMLFLAAILNYIDRQTLSILAPTIQADLHLTDVDYGRIANFFLVAYLVATLLSGRLIDLLGTRLSMALFVGFWSFANVLTGFARSFGSLAGFRFLLGLGEAGNWPGSAKTVAEWFPSKERGVAIGVYTTGATIGAMLAPWLILAIVRGSHWQWAFVATGVLGFCWVIPWLLITRGSGAAGAATAASDVRDAAAAKGATAAAHDVSDGRTGWAAAVRRPEVWVLMVGRMLTDPVWYFYQFWFAKYLFAERGVSQQGLSVTWLIFLAADVGSILGGIASGLLIKRGRRNVPARVKVMLLTAIVMPLSPLITFVPSLWMAIGLAMLLVFAHLSWLVNMTALIVDAIPKRFVATAFGIIAAGSAAGGIMMNELVGHVVKHYTYKPWFIVAAFLHPVAWLLLAAWNRKRAAPAAGFPGSLPPDPDGL
jgi:ACS family hexuronate transporter-like MFS transporter